MAAQIPLVAVAERLRNSAGSSDSLGGIRIDVENKTVELWWKGSLGESQRAIVEKAKRQGIKLNVGVSKYSQSELLAAIQKYLGGRPSVPKELAYLAPRVNGSGVDVGITSEFDVRQLDLGVDTITVNASPIEAQSRAADTPPWWGGAAISGVGTGRVCSSGFAVNWGWSIQRAAGTGLLTANHCAPGGGVVFNNGAGSPIGIATPRPTGQSVVLDSLLIVTPAGSSAAIYDGGVGTGEFAKPVVGRSSVFPGMSVCHSGAFSGVVCGLVVSTIKAQAFVGFGFSQSIAIATPTPFRRPFPVTRVGDSGGPVFTLAADPSMVNAAGVLVGSLFLDCRPPTSVFRCQQSVAFVDLDDVIIFHNVSLMTQ